MKYQRWYSTSVVMPSGHILRHRSRHPQPGQRQRDQGAHRHARGLRPGHRPQRPARERPAAPAHVPALVRGPDWQGVDRLGCLLRRQGGPAAALAPEHQPIRPVAVRSPPSCCPAVVRSLTIGRGTIATCAWRSTPPEGTSRPRLRRCPDSLRRATTCCSSSVRMAGLATPADHRPGRLWCTRSNCPRWTNCKAFPPLPPVRLLSLMILFC